MQKSFAIVATRYAQDVVDGKIPASKWVRLACQRHLDDLERSKTEDFPYEFVTAKAERVCKFLECLPHTKGRWAAKSQLLKLQPWQVFIAASLFGWCKKSNGLRRFREAYLLVPRKNGKSPLAAGIGLYMLTADSEYGAEVYCGATNEKQAWEVFLPAKLMMEKNPELAARLGVQVNAKSLVVKETGSRFLPVIGKPGDGASPSCGICDEYHEATTADLYDTLKTGMVGREQPLLLVISTAGYDISGPCYQLQEDAQKVLEGVIPDEQFFVLIFGIDAEDDWTTEAALKKANPNFGISVEPDDLRRNQETAKANSAKQNIFRTKHLNQWCNASSSWLNATHWAACGDANLKPEHFADCECFVGLDLASKNDVAAVMKIFRKPIDGKMHYFSFPKFYLPSDRTNDPTKQHYQKWVYDGCLIATEGGEIDYETIRRDLLADAKMFKVRELAFDPYNATDFTQQFAAATNIPRVEVPQRVQFLSEPMKMLEAMVGTGRWHHDGNPMMTWMVSCVIAHPDANENLFPRKRLNGVDKIDGPVAAFIALNRALAVPEVPPTVRYQRMMFV